MKITSCLPVILTLLFVACAEDNADGRCTDPELAPPHDRANRTMILRDEGKGLLHLVNLASPAANWSVEIPDGRDLQLVGDNRVMIGTENGYEEHDITTGAKVSEITNHPGTIAARRLRNGNTMLTFTGLPDLPGINLVEIDAVGTVVGTINYPDKNYVRLLRETPSGTFLITCNDVIVELDETGAVLWQGTIAGHTGPHAWQAVRLGSGETAVSSGYAANMQIFPPETEGAPAIIQAPLNSNTSPSFYSGFQVMNDGNFVVANWQGHGANNGEKGIQVVELNRAGEMVWSWKQNPELMSSIQGLLVLDGLDLSKLHVEGCTGALVPVE